MLLQDKVAVITGGTAGLGLGIAEAFLREGAKVVLNGRRADKGEKIVADLGATAPVVDVTDEDWDLNMKWNLYSTFYGTRRALKYMIPQQWGRIINMSSVEGKHGKPVLSGYVTAKHAINGLTKVAAKEVGTQGITVNSICPGLVITEIVRENGPRTAESMGLTFEGMVDLFAAESAIKRPNTVEEVAAMAVLLASDAGGGITGAMLSVDGGTAAY
jgi:3-hydroxybutyrate dehydrogenase